MSKRLGSLEGKYADRQCAPSDAASEDVLTIFVLITSRKRIECAKGVARMVMHVMVLFHEAEALSKCEYYEVLVIAT